MSQSLRHSERLVARRRAPVHRALVVMLLGGAFALTAWSQPIYVDATASPPGTGADWANAFPTLQAALASGRATGQREIRIAQGVYKPDLGPGQTPGNRSASFFLDREGFVLRGGYAGAMEVDPDDRDPVAYLTVLSGDLAGNDLPGFVNNGENSYHVVQVGGGFTATLEGLTVAGGRANGVGNDDRGAGLLAFANSNVNIHDCRFVANDANFQGGAVFFFRSNSNLTDSVFLGNRALSSGGALYYFDALGNKNINRCSFLDNFAGSGGGGGLGGETSRVVAVNSVFIANFAGSSGGNGMGGGAATAGGSGVTAAQFINCTFAANTTSGRGGAGLAVTTGGAAPVISNSIFWGNTDNLASDELAQVRRTAATVVQTSTVQGLSALIGGGNIGDDPLFIDLAGSDGIVGTDDDDVRLGPGSPAVDAGDATLLPPGVTTDRDGADRVQCEDVDMGAYESGLGGGEVLIDCPADVQLACGASTDPGDTGYATAVDECSGAAVAVTFSDSFTATCGDAGVITRTWSADDGQGGFVTCEQTIELVDSSAPVVSVPADLTIDCSESIDPSDTGFANATDDCDAAPEITFSDEPSAGACPSETIITRTWTATDACGNSDSADQVITLTDTTAPTISIDLGGLTPDPNGLPILTVVDANCSGSQAATLPAASASDDCDAAPIVTHDGPAAYPTGQTTIVTYTAADACGNESSERIGVRVKHNAHIEVDAREWTIGLGQKPPIQDLPLANLDVYFYNISPGSCATQWGPPVVFLQYPHIWANCTPAASAVTDADGKALVDLPPGNWLVLAPIDTNGNGVLNAFLADRVYNLGCGQTKKACLRTLRTQLHPRLPAKITILTGSELVVVEPEYVVWDYHEQPYPFVLEALGDWDVTVTVTPPEGFISDTDELSEHVINETSSLQFTITEIGSDLVPTQTRFDIRHNGERVELLSDVGILLTPDYARLRGFDVRKLRRQSLILEPGYSIPPQFKGGRTPVRVESSAEIGDAGEIGGVQPAGPAPQRP